MDYANDVKGPLLIDEYIKCVSMMIEPNDQMRRSLRFYQAPDIDAGKAHPAFGRILKALKHFECQQDAGELDQLLKIIQGKKSLLEIGSAFGGCLKRMANVLEPRSLIVSVDMPTTSESEIDEFRNYLDPLHSLKEACSHINLALGHRVELFIGNSRSTQILESVRALGPFDVGFIDGDHSYEGVNADWENYGPMCKVVAFHDIAGPVTGCVKFWSELVKDGKYRTQEFVNHANGYSGLGIGVVFREEPSQP